MASAIIFARRTLDGTQPVMRRIGEKSAQTFLQGVPLQLNGGFLQEWDGVTVQSGIAGFSKENANNLVANGVSTFADLQAGSKFKFLTFGSVQNQPLAVNIPRGAPFNDGRIGFEPSNQNNVFFGQVGPNQTVVAADKGASFGMTKDADGHWFVDRTKVGATAVVQVVDFDPWDATRGVLFIVIASAAQLVA
jgi:hypothetical protein